VSWYWQNTGAQPLRKFHPTENENQVVVDTREGKTALSHFVSRRVTADLTLADVEIETGRTHQIRVHAASIDHPVLGDERYGDAKLNNMLKQAGLARMYLHARELSFPDLAGDGDELGSKRCEFCVPEDQQWLQVLDNPRLADTQGRITSAVVLAVYELHRTIWLKF